MARPTASDHAPYFDKYISKVKGDTVQEAIKNHAAAMLDFYINLPEDRADYAYAENKWTLKEILQHIIDAERVFGYRILRIARKDATPLASFDENAFAANSGADNRTFQSIKDEFAAVRQATDLLLLSLTEDQLQNQGTASNHAATANAFAFITYGHLLHHREIIEERYL